MIKLFKKLFIFSLAILLVFPFEISQIEASTNNLNTTVEFLIGQDGTVRASDEQVSFYFDNIIIPETINANSVKSAIIEINGVSYNNSGSQTINIDLQQAHSTVGSGKNYTLPATIKPKSFTLKYDACIYDKILEHCTGIMSDIAIANSEINPYDYTLYLKGTSDSGKYSIFSAKLILTYTHPSAGANFLKTTKFFIDQEKESVVSGDIVEKNFTVSISELSPVIESVFVEVTGIAKGSGTGNTIGVSVVEQGGSASYTDYYLDLGSSNVVPFKVRYDVSGTISSGFPGGKNYTLDLKGTGFSTNLWSAKLIITYKYSVTTGNLPAKGELISSTFDTGVVGGAAYNSLMWKGLLSGGKVRMQFATSNCIGGQSDYPACSAGVWGDINTPYVAYDEVSGNCSSSYYYEMLDTLNPLYRPIEIMCSNIHNNKRFFRYKIILCSDDCSNSGSNNPRVDEVVVNWSR